MDDSIVKERYDKEYSSDNIINNIYSLINPIGKYDYFATANMLSWYVKHIIEKQLTVPFKKFIR